MSSINKQILSSGNPFLDKIFNGGFQLGSIILLLEDSPTKLYYQFLKYGIAEGIISGDRIMFYYGNKSTFEEVYNNLPYKSSQVENILNSQPVKVTDANEDNINSHKAWRYENINYTNLIGELSKSLKYIFDLNRPLQDNLKLSIKKELIVTKHIDFFKKNEILPFINEIVDDFENLSQEEKNNTEEIIYNRIYITNFLEFADMKKINYTEIYKSLTALKNLARSLNGFVFITVNKELLDNKIFNLLQYISDYVLKIKPLLMIPDKEKVSNYDAIFHIDKFNWINNIKPLDIETNIYGIIKDKRKVIIEKIDIGVEIDRNTKVKQSDLVKTDFNDMNKNLNNLDF
jgi:archaellum biogenesis ATPase FlaH